MWARLRDLVLDPNTAASNPGRLPVDFTVLFRCHPRWPVALAVGVTVAAALALTVHWAFWLLAALVLAAGLLLGYFAVDQFCNGCVNPGRVLSQTPGLVAVCTDLTTGGRPAPVIKITEQPLGRIPGGPPPVGTPLATVAMYGGESYGVRWEDFHPMLALCASRDSRELQRMLGSISPKDWEELEIGLGQVPTPFVPGLYRIDLPASESSPASDIEDEDEE